MVSLIGDREDEDAKAKRDQKHDLVRIAVGATASIERSCSAQDLLLFAHVSGNTNPLMLPGSEGDPPAPTPIAPSMWVGSLISAVLGNILPGPGTLYRAQTLRFHRRVHIGDKLRVTVTCREKGSEPFAVFETSVEDSASNLVCDGVAEIEAPRATTVTEARDLPQLIVDHKDHFAHLVVLAAQLSPLVTVVVCPEDQNSLGGAALAAEKGLIRPILLETPRVFGPRPTSWALHRGLDDNPRTRSSRRGGARGRVGPLGRSRRDS